MPKKNFTLEDFNFDLPEELIAQYPSSKRDESRLLILNKEDQSLHHKKFKEIINYLRKDDILVFNNVKVINARIYCARESGAKVEIVITDIRNRDKFLAITNRLKRLKEGEIITPLKNKKILFKIISKKNQFIEIESNVHLEDEILEEIGEVPLPPYIKRESSDSDADRYQTVYAENSGGIAAPTAGLHFTEELLSAIREKGIELLYLTLYVSWGTFQPVRENDLSKHEMHIERYVLPEITAEKINIARKNNQRIIAVGTTSLRVLEATFKNNKNIPGYGETDIFIYPPKKIESIDAIITNFHTPHSTLLMLVSSFAGYTPIMNAYKNAVEKEYRFFSYGDSMFIY